MTGPVIRYMIAGESALVVEFGETIDPILNDRVLALDAALSEARIEGVLETVPTYRSLMVHFDARRWASADLIGEIRKCAGATLMESAKPQRWDIPACYDAPFAEDLAEVANALRLTEAAVTGLHTGAVYRIYMYGFAPGFTFLGGLPPELGISRRPSPRPPAPSGSLMIAGGQALITSFAMPTGWYVLGRTPARVFECAKIPPVPWRIGDEIVFKRISAAEFAQWDAKA